MNRALAWNRTAHGAAEAARGVARAPMPAATMGMIVEAVVPAPQGLASSGGPEWWGELLTEASPEDVASSLAYAMRFDKGARPAARAGSSP